MTRAARRTGVRTDTVAYSVAMVLLGVVGLVSKRYWDGPLGNYVWAYGGNVSASFAVFFVVGLAPQARQRGRLAIAGVALLVVELFEVTDGFGVMSNVYDRVDLGANVVGVGLAFIADGVVAAVRTWRSGAGKEPAG